MHAPDVGESATVACWSLSLGLTGRQATKANRTTRNDDAAIDDRKAEASGVPWAFARGRGDLQGAIGSGQRAPRSSPKAIRTRQDPVMTLPTTLENGQETIMSFRGRDSNDQGPAHQRSIAVRSGWEAAGVLRTAHRATRSHPRSRVALAELDSRGEPLAPLGWGLPRLQGGSRKG